MRIILTIFFSSFFISLLAQKSDRVNDSVLLVKINEASKKVDSLNSLYQSEKELNSKYLQIVDRTNESLNLSWTPLNTFIGILGIVLTLISVAIILLAFGNRGQVNKLLKNKSKDFDKLLDEKVQNAQLVIQDKFDKVEVTFTEFFKENKPDSAVAKNFMFDIMGELDEIKKIVNKELKDKK